MNNYFETLKEYTAGKAVINTHSHHMHDPRESTHDLNTLLKNSYVDWCGIPTGDTRESRENYIDKVRYNSYFVWLGKALQDIYDIPEPLSPENWDEYSSRIGLCNADNGHHMRLLKEKCGYEKIVLDAYWDPGCDNGYPELFTPTYRINMFMYGYNRTAVDHNGNNPLVVYGENPADIDEYIAFMRRAIQKQVKNGCVALKSALAYDRGLDFAEVSREEAQKAYDRAKSGGTPEDIKDFQDYVFFEACRIAAELDIPFQCHTGLGRLYKTNAMSMQEAIEKNPDTKFVLFHCSYPWMDDINALLHNCKNVYADLCWLPIISTSACVRMLDEMIEVGTSDKFCWGCDTWTSEESYGALLAVRFAIAKAMAGKIADGYISLADACKIADAILYGNAKKLYKV